MLTIKSVMIIVVDVKKLISLIKYSVHFEPVSPCQGHFDNPQPPLKMNEDDGGDEDLMVTERTGQKQEVAEQNPTSCLHCCGFLCVLIGRY